MPAEVLTPITQAMREGAISRKELKEMMRRSDRPALARLALFLCMMAGTGTLVWMSMGTWWVIPAMFIHGVLLVHHFSLQHECCHYTAFKTRWLNDVVGNYCGFVVMIPNRFFRYEHCDHHTYTQLTGKDPELIELPISLRKYLGYISSIPYWRAKFSELGRHSFGRISDAEGKFIPGVERKSIILEARVMLILYAALVGGSIALNWWEVFYYWLIPVFLGEPVMRAIRMTEHVGRPNVRDMKENTRTNLVTWLMRFLCWNMNYHAEHHYAASVPFHALPRLHKKLEGFVHVERRGYLGAHIDIVSQIIGLSPRADAAKEPRA